jgi:hypothetical protein
MPTISMFFGILIKMYYQEHNPPHFHAYYQGFEAVFDIKTGRRTNGKFPVKAERIIREWTEQYQQELRENWELMERGENMRKIAGADQ